MSAAKYPPPGRIGPGSKGLSCARTCLARAPAGHSGGVAGGSGPRRTSLDHGPGWAGSQTGSRARLDQLWTLKSALTVAGVPSCTW